MTTSTSTRTRTSFIGAHVEPGTKLRLERFVFRNSTSMSAFVDEAVKERLSRLDDKGKTPRQEGLQEAS